MKLIDVWNAVQSNKDKPVSAWGALTSLKKPPAMAYEILEYAPKLGAEFDVIEKQRVKLLYEAAGVSEGSPVDIKPGSPEYFQFANGFNEFLALESKLEPLGIGMKSLVRAISICEENVITEEDLAAVKPFFQEAKPAA